MSAYDELLALGNSLVDALDLVVKTQRTLPATHQLATKDARLLMHHLCLQMRHWRSNIVHTHASGRAMWLDESVMPVLREYFALAQDQLAALKQHDFDLVDSPWRCFRGGPLNALSESIDGIDNLGDAMTEEVPDLPPWSSGDDVPADSTDEASNPGSDSGSESESGHESAYKYDSEAGSDEDVDGIHAWQAPQQNTRLD
ncbi:hypothetical protein LTR56_022965 [Elasticomyces elasticus]|nr:hypothetical protein LTR56_022965 [Elasticomyces elasticus]KAK3626996.1 hypothetical protein LTR22_022953 [Elasticomyces elasticus]KAK4910839.1 hypothetical protein LTR49_020534 [Elasticomyces elasticus]KAK5750416.1 hypothetical protein LTS12_019524 [Elasticomyces elasticus]